MIELNGKLYDVASGKVIDGFSAPKTIVVNDVMPHKSHNHTTEPKPVKPAHKTVQRSQTLMRSAVKKPAHHNATAHPAITKPAVHISPVRLNRAEKVAKSKLISRFGVPKSPVEVKIMPLAVQKAPAHSAPLLRHHTPTVVKVPHVAHSTSSRGIDIEHALHRANSHNQPKVSKPKLSHLIGKRLKLSAKVTKISASLASALLLGGFFLYNNLPNLSMRVAATRAGVDAHLPGYSPAGFDLSNAITYGPGEITVLYKSNSDERSFALTQKATDLTSEALLEQHVVAADKPYQTLENAGKTIYIYSGSNAAWIEDGTLFQIEGNSSLSSEQLLRLAGSM